MKHIKKLTGLAGGVIFGLTVFSLTATRSWADAPPTFAFEFGEYGTNDGQFTGAYGLTWDSAGNYYVIDYYQNRVQKFDRAGLYLGQWGSPGTGDGQFNTPFAIATDNHGSFYVADFNERIQKFGPNGEFLLKWGEFGSGNGQFHYPTGVAVDRDGSVFVADQYNQRVQKFDANGNFLTKWGSGGSGNSQFQYALFVAVDDSGNVYVTDEYNHRVQKFDNNGGYLGQWGTLGTGPGQFNRPQGIAVDSLGNVYVADKANGRIQKFTTDGVFLTQLTGRGPGDPFPGWVTDVAVSRDGAIITTASGVAGKVWVFTYATITGQPQSQVGYWGKSVTFSVSLSGGKPPYSYQWLKDGVPVDGATDSQLVLSNLQDLAAGSYTVVVTEASGHILPPSAPATLTVLPDVGIATYAGLTIKGGVGQTYGIQATTDMTASTWIGVANVTLTQPTQIWYESHSTAEQPKRFYRVVAGPISIP